MVEKIEKPNPGSENAIKQGCLCPVIDNHYGRGVPTDQGPEFWYSENCPLHILESEIKPRSK